MECDMAEQKNAFDDTKYEEEWGNVLKISRENKKLTDDFSLKLIERINNGITTFEHELNSLPEKYRTHFEELYKQKD